MNKTLSINHCSVSGNRKRRIFSGGLNHRFHCYLRIKSVQTLKRLSNKTRPDQVNHDKPGRIEVRVQTLESVISDKLTISTPMKECVGEEIEDQRDVLLPYQYFFYSDYVFCEESGDQQSVNED